MKMSIRFTLAIELLLLCEKNKDNNKITSTFIAEQTRVSPLIIRQIMADLSSRGIIESKKGVGGISLLKPLNKITLLDVYQSIGEDEGTFLKFPNSEGIDIPDYEKNLSEWMKLDFIKIRKSFEKELSVRTVADYYKSFE